MTTIIFPRLARENYDKIDHPRQFRPPVLLFTADSYFNMVDWDKEQKTEPPLTMDFSDREILDIL